LGVARQEHLRLIQQGSYVWNTWREKHEGIIPHLICANLQGADLVGADLIHAEIPRAKLNAANLMGANLSGATAVGTDFTGAELGGANLINTTLSGAYLTGANLSLANLSGANLTQANLSGANLLHANLIGATLIGANLKGANLSGADLSGANLVHAELRDADLSLAILSQTILASLQLGGAKGLDTCQHLRPSVIDHATLGQSGRLPPVFLRGCGLPDSLIEYWASEPAPAVNVLTCLVGFTGKDLPFVELLQTDLQSKGVRCWLAPHDNLNGAKFRGAAGEWTGVCDQMILVLSANCVRSSWVEKQVQLSLAREREHQCRVLFPICLDNSPLEIDSRWAVDLRHDREIGDFRRWQYRTFFWQALERLVAQLKGKGPL
jgi:uncharacterized protein YjbI with pentapeptide repeats